MVHYGVMLKKIVPILMLYFALAIMLGHNFIVHNHYDQEQNKIAHHHHDGHHHHHDHDPEEETDDWGHVFSSYHHVANGLTYYPSLSSVENLPNRFHQNTTFSPTKFIFSQIIFESRQKAPPDIADYYKSQNLPPFGLRAPPIFIA